MSCSINTNSIIEWTLDHKHIMELYKHLYDSVEHGGKFKLNTVSKRSSSSESKPGQKDSADAPDAIVNWHTHPVSCYKQEKTVWGWPSGEDMRESIIYGLRGSACHIVPSVEGVYTIQPNPCIITSLIEIDTFVDQNDYPNIDIPNDKWGDFLRGFIILAIEIYFRSTHVFRTIDYMKHGKYISADDFIKFANVFKLNNLFSKTPVTGCSSIGCNEIVNFENKKTKQISFKSYVENYEYDTDIYFINEHGDHKDSNKDIKFLQILKTGGIDILKNVLVGTKCKFPIQLWHSGKVFLIKLYHNNIKFDNVDIDYHDLPNKDKVKYIMSDSHSQNEIYLPEKTIITFKLFDMKGDCDHINLKKHVQQFSKLTSTPKIKTKSVPRRRYGRRSKSGSKSGRRSRRRSGVRKNNRDTIMIIGSNQCGYCGDKNKIAHKIKNKLNFNYKFKEYPTIREAIDKAQILSPNKKVDSIPAFFINGKYSEKQLF